jgi:hypothetical protein
MPHRAPLYAHLYPHRRDDPLNLTTQPTTRRYAFRSPASFNGASPGPRIHRAQAVAAPNPADRRLWARGPRFGPISGYAPHPDSSIWLAVLVVAAIAYLALTFPR